MSDLEVWSPLVREFTIEGQTVTIAPLKFRDFARVQMALAKVQPMLGHKVVGKDEAGKPQVEWRAGELLAEGSDAVAALVSAGTGQSAEWVGRQDPKTVLELLGAVLEVNADFSRRRIGPALAGLAEALVRTLRGAGSSPGSAGSDTASPTSGT